MFLLCINSMPASSLQMPASLRTHYRTLCLLWESSGMVICYCIILMFLSQCWVRSDTVQHTPVKRRRGWQV